MIGILTSLPGVPDDQHNARGTCFGTAAQRSGVDGRWRIVSAGRHFGRRKRTPVTPSRAHKSRSAASVGNPHEVAPAG
ncbi:hypothetical protein Aph02nite_39910 [Actinoplanes philippinensis]|nr:hypothetical protein Aph02nite_39910 [Actinoplanes philippinensis]